MSDALETIWVAMPTDRVLKRETMYGWQVTENTDDWDEDDFGDPCELVAYRRADLPPTTAQIMADPRVQALMDALEKIQRETARCRGDQAYRDACKMALSTSSAALAAFTKELK